MASQPPAQLPRPGFMQRVRDAVLGAPLAQPLGENPVAEASPAEPEAKPIVGDVFTRAYGGFSIDPAWLTQLALNDDTILQREGAHDLKLYDALLDDDTAFSTFQQRRFAVVSRPWTVEPGDDSPRAKEAADHLRGQIERIGWDRICDNMLYGRWYGYAVGECIFEIGPDGRYRIQDIVVPDRKWFGFTNGGELRMRTAESPEGEIVPPNKFWAYRCGATHDFAPYGTGLAHWCYWPIWFKKNGLRFWAVYLEKFGQPTALGKFPAGSKQDVVKNLLASAAAVGRDSAVVVPNDTELTLMAEGRSGSGTHKEFVDSMDVALMRVVLSQAGTSKSEAQGIGSGAADVHKVVRDEVVRADSDMLHESFNRGPAAWLTAWNFGPDVAPPRVYRNLEDQEDLNSIVERDTKLKALGWVRTEDSAKEVYGDCYEKAEPPAQLTVMGQPGSPVAVNDNAAAARAEARAKRAAEFSAMDPAPLYVSRKVQPETGRKLLAWARSKGIPNLEKLADLHVTVLKSREPVDWFEMGDPWGPLDDDGILKVMPGGPRAILKLGDKGAIVLRFNSGALKYRNEEMRERGASSDFPTYEPHITLGYAPDFEIPDDLEAFQDELLFGPELFEPLQVDLQPFDDNVEFSVAELDAVDKFAAQLANETDPVLMEFAATLKGKLHGIKSAQGLRVALLEALERWPADRLGEIAGLPMAATRAAAQAGATNRLQA